MNENLNIDVLNKISLKPRFSIEILESKAVIVERFRREFARGGDKFLGRIIDHHVVIDVPAATSHFWSPQLHAEIEKEDESSTIIKGLFGPKPSVWSLFMFVHFGVALAFVIFLVLFYTRWSLQQNYRFAMLMSIVMPIAWFALYFLGRLGRKKGGKQMQELQRYFLEILDGN